MRATTICRRGDFPPDAATDRVRLDAEGRNRRRITLTTNAGKTILLDLPQVTFLHDGDALVTEDGSLIAVDAAPEPVLDVSAPPEILLRLAWHVGNRHVPVQLLPSGLRLREDHVLAVMLKGLGASVTSCVEPFDPEPGAYAHHG